MNEDEFYKRLAQAKGERDQAMRDYLEACRARDEAQRALSAEVQQLVKDRDFLRNHYSMETAAMLRAELASARAEIEALKYPRAYLPPGEERSLALSAIMISQAETEIRTLKAEVERLRAEWQRDLDSCNTIIDQLKARLGER